MFGKKSNAPPLSAVDPARKNLMLHVTLPKDEPFSERTVADTLFISSPLKKTYSHIFDMDDILYLPLSTNVSNLNTRLWFPGMLGPNGATTCSSFGIGIIRYIGFEE